MTDQTPQEFTPDALTALPEEQQKALKSIMVVHEIERAMLTRAIEVLSKVTKRTPEEVVTLLSKGLGDEDYGKAVDEVAKPKPSLYLPS